MDVIIYANKNNCKMHSMRDEINAMKRLEQEKSSEY